MVQAIGKKLLRNKKRSKAMQQSFQSKRVRKLLQLKKLNLAVNFAIVVVVLLAGIMVWTHWKTVDVMIKVILHLAGIGSGSYLPIQKQ
jgi:hypothetical protein